MVVVVLAFVVLEVFAIRSRMGLPSGRFFLGAKMGRMVMTMMMTNGLMERRMVKRRGECRD